MYNFSYNPKRAPLEGRRDRLNGIEMSCPYVGCRKRQYRKAWRKTDKEIEDVEEILKEKVCLGSRGEKKCHFTALPSQISRIVEFYKSGVAFCSGHLDRLVIHEYTINKTQNMMKRRCHLCLHGVPKIFFRDNTSFQTRISTNRERDDFPSTCMRLRSNGSIL